MLRSHNLFFALPTLLLLAQFGHAADWVQWRGPTRTGWSPETNLPSSWSPEGENLIWKAPYGCRSTPIVMKGRVFFINYAVEKVKDKDGFRERSETIQERIVCLDEATGKHLWEHQFSVFHTDIVTVRLGWTNLEADPATGYVYAHGTQGFLMCLDGMGPKAKVVWQRSLSEEYGRITGYGGRVTSPIVYDDLLVIGMLNSNWGSHGKGGNRFVAFDKKTGEVRWWSEPAGQVKDTYYSVPIVAHINGVDLIISGGADGSVFAMKARTGEPVWRYQFGTTAVNCSPVVEGSLVYIGHGEENPDNNIQGRVVCLDASQVKDGKPKLVWQKDGLKARYTSPIIHAGRLYITDEIGKLYCLDGKTGDQIWKFAYGRNSRGSPVLADGKIYVGEVNSKFHILEPGKKKCKALHEVFFPATDGVADVEINGSPAVANGRVFFATSDEFYCIGLKGSAATTDAKPTPPAEGAKPGPLAHVQIVPADVVVHPGDSVAFKVRGFDASGNESNLDASGAEWSLPMPTLPPGAKGKPPALDGTIAKGVLKVDAKKSSQHGLVAVKVGNLVGTARVRVAPRLPYTQDFSKIPDGAVPGGWVNTQGKFLVATVDGEKVIKKVNDKASPLIARGNAYITLPTTSDYTIECDVQGTKAGTDLPDVGIVCNRYTLLLAGNIQKLRLVSWDALPRVDKTIAYEWQPGVWYRLKLTFEMKGDHGLAKGKAWRRDQPEPNDWTVILEDPRPIAEGAPALYGYVTGILEGQPGTDIYYDNLKVTPNKK